MGKLSFIVTMTKNVTPEFCLLQIDGSFTFGKLQSSQVHQLHNLHTYRILAPRKKMDIRAEANKISRPSIESALDEILADKRFRTSPQMSAFLRYIVEQTLQGNASRIKAYTIAVDALGKPESFDPQSNPSVRVLARRLRASLIQYYKHEGKHAETEIAIKLGSYVPSFINKELDSDLTKKKGLFVDSTLIIKASNKLVDKFAIWYSNHHRLATIFGVMLIAILTWTNTTTHFKDQLDHRSIESTHTPTDSSIPLTEIASLEYIDNFVTRPNTPVIAMSKISKKTGFTYQKAIHNTLSHYDNIMLTIRKQVSKPSREAWPEQYTLKFLETSPNTFKAILSHEQSGDLVYTKELAKIEGSQSYVNLVKELVHTNGKLLNHYRNTGTITPTMKCVFLFDDYYQEKTRNNRLAALTCNEKLANENDHHRLFLDTRSL